jgi:hypothetical protein
MSRYIKKTSFPFALLVALVAIIFSFRGEAQLKKVTSAAPVKIKALKPQVGYPVATATSTAVRDMKASPDVDLATMADFERRVVNQLNTEFDRPNAAAGWKVPSVDAAIAGKPSSVSAAQQPSSVTPPAILSFEGISDLDNSNVGLGQVNPPDTNADVSFTQIVETVNSSFRVYNKSGVPLTPVIKQSQLFAALGGQCAKTDPGDPIVLYDRMADRWQVSQFNFASSAAPPFHQCFAVSKTNDATGEWYLYDFVTPTGNFPDYPKVGVWSDGYYMSTREFIPNPQSFNGLGAFAFNRAKMLQGDPTAEMIVFTIPNDANYPSGVSSGLIVADHDGLLPPPAGAPCIFAIHDDDEFGNADEIHFYDFHADFTTPANSTFTERPESPIAVPAFDDRNPNGRADIEEPAPGEALDSIGDRLMFRLSYRNFGGGVQSLVTNHTVNVSGVTPNTAANYQAASRYYEFRTAANAGPYSLFDSATYSPDAGNGATGMNRWMGSTAVDVQGNLAMGYSASSTTVVPNIRYVGRAFNELGPSLTNEVVLFPGQGVQQSGLNGGNRWGDYSSMSVDPTDDCTFWYATEYEPLPNGAFNWHTRIGSFKFPTCTAPAQGTLSGKITNCETGEPISGVIVQVTSTGAGTSTGFSAPTGDDGTYTLHLAPGSYTVSASLTARNCTPSANSTVVITNGGGTPYSTCLSGVAHPAVDNTNPVSFQITGGNGNGIVDPNECNILNVRLTNSGCATAHTVSATLTTNTPGVTVQPPGTSGYPDIPIDGIGANQQPYRFTTDPGFACGTPVDFTLTTTFNGGQTVSNFSIPTCTETAPPESMSGTLTSTDPTTPNNGRLGRNSASTCAGKACPGPLAGLTTANHYDVVGPFVNTGPVAACVTFTMSSPNGSGLIGITYVGAFDPNNFCTNYVGDSASGQNGDTKWQATIAPGQMFNVVIQEATANQGTNFNGGAGSPYTITVEGLSAPPAAGNGPCVNGLTTSAQPPSTTVGNAIYDQATLTTGSPSTTGSITFRLYGPNNGTCTGTPIFTSVVPVNGDSTYASQSFTPLVSGTYNWVATYSGDANNSSVSGTCGDPNESTTVNDIPTPTPTATATATPVATATASATATATASPSASAASQTTNLSTRMRTDTGNNVAIGGFTITGSVSKHVIIRALGPSLTKFGFSTAEVLADPTLEVHGPGNFGTITNNNWRDSQEAQIKADGLAPTNDLESAIDATLPPGAYTAIVSGNGSATGLCTFEVYDLDTAAASQLANLSTRAFVGTGNNVVIAGFVLGNNQGNDNVIVRGLGPSLASFGISNTLADPTLELRDENGTLLKANNDWQDDPSEEAQITAAGLAPSDDKESAIAVNLPPGLYTAILAGSNNGQGVGTVEVYDRGP